MSYRRHVLAHHPDALPVPCEPEPGRTGWRIETTGGGVLSRAASLSEAWREAWWRVSRGVKQEGEVIS